jgi:nucleoside-diphosphate-sugar epimerase
MKILVTGSEGSLMQFVIRELVAAGHQVRGVDSFFRYGKVERQRPYEFVQGDLCDPVVVDRVTDGMEIIIQAAARIFGVAGFHKYPADILSHDVVLHQNVLWAAQRQRVKRVIYISSSMVYERCTTVPSREDEVDDMRIPFTDYGLSKLVGERLSRAFQKQYGLAYTIWRPFNIITPLERPEHEPGISHVFADFVQRIVMERQNPVKILGDGQQVRCFTWIEDVGGTIAKFVAAHETENEAFNLGNPRPVTMMELANLIYQRALRKGLIENTGDLAFEHMPIYADDVRVRIPSIEKARSVLGFEPKVQLEEALDHCLDQAMAAKASA